MDHGCSALKWTPREIAPMIYCLSAFLCLCCHLVVNQEGQPLIEGKLKEKQVRWKFIKRWKTRYFTLAGNQLLFRRGKSVRSQ